MSNKNSCDTSNFYVFFYFYLKDLKCVFKGKPINDSQLIVDTLISKPAG